MSLLLSFGAVAGTPAQAAPVTGFNPGNIISDENFYNSNAMTAAEVQAFLNKQVPRCTIGDPGRAPGTAIYGTTVASNCLKDAYFSTSSRAANAYCASYAGSPSESAATIITKAARSCGVSQKTLLVMLEKEQSLVSDTWPTVRQFNVAMGYACPDSGPNNSANCDPSQTGFMQQVYRAAWQIKVYKAHPNNYNYRPGWNTIQWHPNVACGTSQVYIENWATAALYIYTPYRPNQAALDAGWGTGDSCSTYGNRNFYLLFTTWFGNAQAPDGTPFGELKDLWATNNTIHLWGWAVDLDDRQAPLQIHVKFGPSWAATTANAPNGSAEALYPGSGPNHGFGLAFTAPPGAQQVCVYAKNIGSGADRLLGCQELTVPDGSPAGKLGDLWATPGTISMWGWALDPDTVDPIVLHVSINGRWAVVNADAQNLSTQGLYPNHGTNHGFSARIPADAGSNKVCVYAINQGPGSNTTLGCRTVTVPSGSPVGQVKEMWGESGVIKMWGWALDPDTVNPIDLHVSINGRWAVVPANAQNLSTQASYPNHGTNHGFGAVIPADPGSNKVCVYAINQGAGSNTTLKCQDVVVPSSDPRGEVKELIGLPGQISMWGWAADPDTTDPIDLHVRVDGTQWYVVPANAPYSAMAQLMPEVGLNHGFGARIPATPGSHEVCVFAVNAGPGSSKTLRCATVTS
ncbi:hypothetical protein [Leucobacter sp. gxy201]|uniref:hypothetical protein n=1 Tax=Leucobacter sp. gxy201 TaxID=2957200 RepID=UPI003DA003E8